MTPSMTQTEIKRVLAPILKRIEALEAAQPPQDEMENYRLALAYISKQSTDPQSRELAETALNSFTHTRPHRETP